MQGPVCDGRFIHRFRDYIRNVIEREGIGRIETGSPRRVVGQLHALGECVRAGVERRLRIFERDGQPECLVEFFRQPYLRLTSERESRYVLRIDRQRNVLGARRNAFALQGDEGPVLAGQQVQPYVVPIHLVVQDPDARRIGIGFIRVRGLGGPEEVELTVESQVDIRRRITLRQYRESTLTGLEAKRARARPSLPTSGSRLYNKSCRSSAWPRRRLS